MIRNWPSPTLHMWLFFFFFYTARPWEVWRRSSQIEQTSHVFHNESFQTHRWSVTVRKEKRAFCINFPHKKIQPDFHLATPINLCFSYAAFFFTLSLNPYSQVPLRASRFLPAFCSIRWNARMRAKNLATMLALQKIERREKTKRINRIYQIKVKTLFWKVKKYIIT